MVWDTHNVRLLSGTTPVMATVNPKFAQNGDEKGKVFIGGLSWETTTASMLKYFSRYGEVIDCVVMKNQQSGKSRGFGFVKFRDTSCVETVLSSGPHILDGRQIDPKACNPRSMNKVGSDQGSPKNNDAKNKNKIFLGGLPSNCTESQIKDVFTQFGKVNDVTIMWDQEKQKPRGFGFLSFEDDESVDRVCHQHYITVAGKKVECKRAEPREMKELGPFQLGPCGMFANGLAMPGMALGPGLISSPYQTLAAQQHLAAAQGIALLPAGPHLIPLTLPGAGGMSMAGGMAGGMAGSHMVGAPGMAMAGSSMGDAELPNAWPPQVAAQYIPTHPGATQLGASQASMGLEQYGAAQQQDGQSPQMSGYISSSPVPGSTTPVPLEEQGPPQKNPYILYSSPQASQLDMLTRQMEARERYNKGILGNYPQEASSYGPARGLVQEGAMHSGMQTPYTASITYAAAPGLALQAPMYNGMNSMGTLSNGYPTSVPMSFAYGGPSDATSAYSAALAAARSSMASGYHPYRR